MTIMSASSVKLLYSNKRFNTFTEILRESAKHSVEPYASTDERNVSFGISVYKICMYSELPRTMSLTNMRFLFTKLCPKGKSAFQSLAGKTPSSRLFEISKSEVEN